jgi:hypothetical protein
LPTPVTCILLRMIELYSNHRPSSRTEADDIANAEVQELHMNNDEEYRRQAAEAEKQARLATNDIDRAAAGRYRMA